MEINNSDQLIGQTATPLPPQIWHYPTKKSKKHMFIIMGIVLFLILLGSGIYSSQAPKKQVLVSHTTAPLGASSITPTTGPTVGWKSISIDTISFEYPSEFQDPEFVTTQFGQSAEMKTTDKTQRIVVMSGLNKGNSEKELTEYLDTFVQAGGQRLFLDDNEAVISKNDSSEQKITTIYMNAKDKKSQYSIVIQIPKTYDEKKVDQLLDQIFATLQFK